MAWLRHQVTVPLVLAASLATTGWLWQHEREVVARQRTAQLDADLRELAGRIEQRMAAYAQVLRGVQGLFAAAPGAPGADPALLRAYVDSLQLGADFAGLGGVGLALPVKRRLAVTQIEPALAANLRWLGTDLLAAGPYRDAMHAAGPAGRVTITARLPAPAGAADGAADRADAALALLAPVAADAWVMAPFRVGEMMAGLYGEAIPGVDIRIFDGVANNAQTLLYDSTGAAPPAHWPVADAADAVEYVAVAGRIWTLAVRARAGRDAAREADAAGIIAVAGIGLSAALAALTWGLSTSRARALAIAGRMTRELRDSESRFRYLAQYDELTRLPNRALLNDRLRLALAQARRDRARLALLFIDLDGFKPVNDSLGHAVGDLLLVAVAERMQHSVRESDTVARIGGDEFVVLLPAVHEDRDALLVAEKIRHALNEPFVLAGTHTVSISSSTGVAFYPEHGEDGDRLSAGADHAMYHAKQSGRNRVSVFRAPAAPSSNGVS